ncbi:DUF4922 domain-containing protein [Candidatus Saccharibacteria bacterium]|nr:MAG: DUF4922 domain-containing protein [Candidatus Saccharibacteria bacterium]
MPEIAQPASLTDLMGTGYEDRLFDAPEPLRQNANLPGGMGPIITMLLEQQRAAWKDLSINFAGLEKLKQSQMRLAETSVVIQLNERRAGRGKPTCFLDAQSLPAEQKGVSLAGLFVAFNPYAVLLQHTTGIFPQHTDQSLDKLLAASLRLAVGLGQPSAVFYNGPLAGASAPHHAHIQAVRHPQFPIEASLARFDKTSEQKAGQSILYLPENLGRTVLAIDSPNISSAEDAVRKVIERLPMTPEDGYNEPRVNLMVRALGTGTLRVFIAPREARVVTLKNGSKLRPATLETIGGLLVVTTEDDFFHLGNDPDEVARVFRETSCSLEKTRDCLHDLPLAA